MSGEDQRIIDDAIKIANAAQSRSLVLRIIGALAVRIHSTNSADLFMRLGRLGNTGRFFSDADFVVYSKQRGKLRGLFEDEFRFRIEGYSMLQAKDRMIYSHPDGIYKVDVFLDRLAFSHEICFGSDPGKGRLDLDFPTISLADLLLEKLQIHQITEKDVKDMIVLLHEHRMGSEQDRETIDAKHIALTLANDWGFWYDASMNLDKVLTLAADYQAEKLISREVLIGIQDKIAELKRHLDEEPKSPSWLSRAKIGTQKQWWKDVEERSR